MLSALALNLALTLAQEPQHTATLRTDLKVLCPVAWQVTYVPPDNAYSFSCADNGITVYVPSSEVPRRTRTQIRKLSRK